MAQLEATVRALQTTLASISQGILMVDLQGRVQVFNPRVCELLQVPARLLRTRPSASSVVRYLHERGDFGDQGALIEPHARAALLAIAEGHSDVLPPLYRRTTPAGGFAPERPRMSEILVTRPSLMPKTAARALPPCMSRCWCS